LRREEWRVTRVEGEDRGRKRCKDEQERYILHPRAGPKLLGSPVRP
jgi:hypothetical protein